MNRVVFVSQTDGIKHGELSEERQYNPGLVEVLAKLLWHTLFAVSQRQGGVGRFTARCEITKFEGPGKYYIQHLNGVSDIYAGTTVSQKIRVLIVTLLQTG